MACPGKGFFHRKSEGSANPEVQGQSRSGAERELRTCEPVQETPRTTDPVWKRFSLLERGPVYPIVKESPGSR